MMAKALWSVVCYTTARISWSINWKHWKNQQRTKRMGKWSCVVNWWASCRKRARHYDRCCLPVFLNAKRKFIIADAPGHVQYTRNMITGASNASLIIILIDARQGVVEQTRRHSIIASLLKIPHVVVAINKMDLVEYSQDVFNNIVIDYSEVAKQLGLQDVTIFLSVHWTAIILLTGQRILHGISGKPLLEFLEE
jgi:GTPases - Sulfate adenylate transferase subunit 1